MDVIGSASFPIASSLISVDEPSYTLPENCSSYIINITLHTGYNGRRNELVI